MVTLRNRRQQSRRLSVDSVQSDEQDAEGSEGENRDSPVKRSEPAINTNAAAAEYSAPSDLFKSVVEGRCDSIYQLSLAELLNFCFEISGYPANLYSPADYAIDGGPECIEMIDSSLERGGNQYSIMANSPLMKSLVKLIRCQFIDKSIQACYNKTVTELLVDIQYVPSTAEFMQIKLKGQMGVSDRLIRSSARLIELCTRSSDQIDPNFTNLKQSPFDNLALNVKQLFSQIFGSSQVNSEIAQSFRNWLILFATSNIQILRVTGIYALQLIAQCAMSRVEELVVLLGAQRRGTERASRRASIEASARENEIAELDLTFGFLMDTAFATFRDRVSDISPIVACLAAEGLMTVSLLGQSAYLDVITHVGTRHPSPVVRAVNIASVGRLLHILTQDNLLSKLYEVDCLRKAPPEYKHITAVHQANASYKTEKKAVLRLTIDVLLPVIIRHSQDISLLAAWACAEFLETLFELDRNAVYEFEDRQVTAIVSLVFSKSTRLPLLPILATFIDRVVFAHTIIEKAGQNQIGAEVVYSTLIQFLTEYADDIEWQPQHINVIKAFFPLSPFCRDFQRIWEFLNVVYRPTSLSDTAQQYDWLVKAESSNSLIFLVQAIWTCQEIVSKRAAQAKIMESANAELPLPSLFRNRTICEGGSPSASLITGWKNILEPICWTPESAFLSQILIDEALQNEFPLLLQRAKLETPQIIQILNILYNMTVMRKQMELTGDTGFDRSESTFLSFRARVQRLQEFLQSMIMEPTSQVEPLVLHSLLKCLEVIVVNRSLANEPDAAGLKVYYGIYSKGFNQCLKSAQSILKRCNKTSDLISESARASPRSSKVDTVLHILSTDPVDKNELRSLLIQIRIYLYNDKENLISDKLHFIDDLLNYVEKCTSTETFTDIEGQSTAFDLNLVINALDVLWLCQAKFVERLSNKFDDKILPEASIFANKPLDFLTVSGRSRNSTIIASQTSLSAKSFADHLRSFDEDLEIYKEMNLQISCYLAQYSEKCRQLLLTHKSISNTPDLMGEPSSAKIIACEALLGSLQCARLLCANSLFQAGLKLWPHIRKVMQLIHASDAETDLLRESISKHALACFMPPQNNLTVEVAYFIDSMKQIYSARRREVEQYFTTHDFALYGFMNQFVGNQDNSIGPVEIWDVYKNLSTTNHITQFVGGLNLENTAFVAQAQLTRTVCRIPDKNLWKDSSVGPVVLAYFRSTTPILRNLACEFVERCLEYDAAAAQHVEDVTDRPLLLSLMLTTIQTLLKRALESEKDDKFNDVIRMASAFAEQLPKDYWRSQSNVLFMNFIWMTIQKAHTCDPRGYLLDVVIDGLIEPAQRRMPKRYSRQDANLQIEALKQLATSWQNQNPSVVVEKSFYARLLRFLRVCLPTALLPDENTFAESWPVQLTNASSS